MCPICCPECNVILRPLKTLPDTYHCPLCDSVVLYIRHMDDQLVIPHDHGPGRSAFARAG
jgi:hypothetical protein